MNARTVSLPLVLLLDGKPVELDQLHMGIESQLGFSRCFSYRAIFPALQHCF